jgi:ABC-type sugar transport system substrate-binding protein
MKFLISLIMAENAYQQDQAAAASEAARLLRAHVQILYADNDAITQSQQLLKVIQSSSTDSRPDAIVCHPVGTTLKQVAREAMARGMGWALLNREDNYLAELQTMNKPSFCVTVDQEEVGRIQGRQFGALLPQGGLVLYILGPSTNPVFKLRTTGMESTKPRNIQITTLRGKPSVWRDSYTPDRHRLVKDNWRQVLRANPKGNDEAVKLKPKPAFN